ncbi:hypothetical protein CEUSTIGMA_g12594.t1 [Chlamydomonas eustigma]|uniref:Ubiquitin thioesterase OTU n=1 Tax=Chlamydomonas eustigma TaxID=1157962 RepID=A0A250XQ58_9CHLO|nr:hypothetical protein CEUSTIGMA_g12594.t1 [Chlamydomonas eustigma]|eukprot:GAX85176.1 hypothetical protein CEUSTIGMA_g12594.t1 [Chlamydomonas eustigma]
MSRPKVDVSTDTVLQSTSSAKDETVPIVKGAFKAYKYNKLSKQQVLITCTVTASVITIGLSLWATIRSVRRRKKPQTGEKSQGKKCVATGLKATSRCVPLADGSACVVRRPIPADNSCMFNAVGYVMHHSKSKASFLRSVVAREVSSDPKEYSEVFLGMNNAAYCAWIMNRVNWGGGIELSIMAKHYGREIAAWNIETAKGLVFGEESGYQKQVMLIYNGIHYDALAISPGPKAPESEDVTEFNPRTKRGKMIVAAAQKLVELTNKGSQFVSNSPKLRCSDCKALFTSQIEMEKHAKASGHQKYDQVK